MSVREQRIRNLANKLGIKIESVTWEPIGAAMEMCGPSGGWLVYFEDEDGQSPVVAYHYRHVQQQLRAIAKRRKAA